MAEVAAGRQLDGVPGLQVLGQQHDPEPRMGVAEAAGALWRSRAVPWWLPIVFVVLTVGVFTLDGVALNVVQAIQLLVPLVIAWYLVRHARADRTS